MKKLMIVWGAMVLILLYAIPTWAAPWHFGGGDQLIDKNETVAGDYFFQGSRLEIAGEIKGDLIVFAEEVIVTGKINGSILGIVTQKLTVDGLVRRSIRVLAGEVFLGGSVAGSFTGAANLCAMEAGSKIRGVWGTFVQLKMAGFVDGPVDVTGQFLSVGGRIRGDVKVKGNAVEWLAPLTVTGKILDYTAHPKIPKGERMQVRGGYSLGRETDDGFGPIGRFLMLWVFVWFIVSLLMSLIFLRLFPVTALRITEPSKLNFRRSFVVGLLGLVGVPLLCVVMALTVVGIPIALLLALLYLFVLLFLNIPLYLWLGRLFFPKFRPTLALLAGSIFILFIWLFPGPISVLINLFLTSVGFGLIVSNLKFQVEKN